MMAHAHRLAYWHSENVTCYVTIDKCPICGKEHGTVVLYTDEDHVEYYPRDLFNGVKTPCGGRVDLIYERSKPGGRAYDSKPGEESNEELDAYVQLFGLDRWY